MRRTRLVRPEFFTDEVVAHLPVATRLLYIGLWTTCDDAGYFERRPAQLAAQLLPFEGPARRVRLVETALHQLADAGRIRWLECGNHGVVPTLPRHSAMGGIKTETTRKLHERDCRIRALPAPLREATGTSVSDSLSDSLSDSDSGGAPGAPVEENGGTFGQLMAQNGYRPERSA